MKTVSNDVQSDATTAYPLHLFQFGGELAEEGWLVGKAEAEVWLRLRQTSAMTSVKAPYLSW